MTDRLALVTGGTGGIGTEICAELAERGLGVVAVDLPGGGANGKANGGDHIAEWKSQLKERGLDVDFEPADVSDYNSCKQLARTLERDYGTVEILVNAAGITRDSTLRKMELDQWE